MTNLRIKSSSKISAKNWRKNKVIKFTVITEFHVQMWQGHHIEDEDKKSDR